MAERDHPERPGGHRRVLHVRQQRLSERVSLTLVSAFGVSGGCCLATSPKPLMSPAAAMSPTRPLRPLKLACCAMRAEVEQVSSGRRRQVTGAEQRLGGVAESKPAKTAMLQPSGGEIQRTTSVFAGRDSGKPPSRGSAPVAARAHSQIGEVAKVHHGQRTARPSCERSSRTAHSQAGGVANVHHARRTARPVELRTFITRGAQPGRWSCERSSRTAHSQAGGVELGRHLVTPSMSMSMSWTVES